MRRSCRSLTGAWIETAFPPPAPLSACRSLPHGSVDRNNDVVRAAAADPGRSLTGAWIETEASMWSDSYIGVAPSRERGSKPGLAPRAAERQGVTPSRERGSKQVRPLHPVLVHTVAPSRERGSKQDGVAETSDARRSLPHGSVDRNVKASICASPGVVAPSRERGSKPHHVEDRSEVRGRSLTGAWVEAGSGWGRAGSTFELSGGIWGRGA